MTTDTDGDRPLTLQETLAWVRLHGFTLWRETSTRHLQLRREGCAWWLTNPTAQIVGINVATLSSLRFAMRSYRDGHWWRHDMDRRYIIKEVT